MNYFEGINNLIRKRQEEAVKIRRDYIKNIFAEQEEYRYDLKKMLGWPLVGYKPQ